MTTSQLPVVYNPGAVSNAVATIGTDVTVFNARSIISDIELARAQDIALKFDPTASTLAISNFGNGPQAIVAEKTRPMLETVKVRTVGASLDALTELNRALQGVDLSLAYRQPGAVQKAIYRVIKALDPIIAFLRSMEDLDRNMDRHVERLQECQLLLVTRISQLDRIKAEIEKALPELYVYAAAAEFILDREEAKLREMEAKVATSNDPRLPIQANEQRGLVTRMRVKVFDLHQAAMNAYLMGPVTAETIKAAQIVNDQIGNGILSAIPQMRLALAVIIAQYDTSRAVEKARATSEARRRFTDEVSKRLGQAGAEQRAMLEDKAKDVDNLRALRDALVARIEETVQLDSDLKGQFSQYAEAFEEITTSLRNATARLGQGIATAPAS